METPIRRAPSDQRKRETPVKLGPEAARLQGFPDTYCFAPSLGPIATSAQLSKWIGNAVTVPLGYAAALSALLPTHAQSDPERNT